MYRYIAFFMIDQAALGAGETPEEALHNAIENQELTDHDFLEVIDCGDNGSKIWTAHLPLYKVSPGRRTVFRGNGYADHPGNIFPPVALSA